MPAIRWRSPDGASAVATLQGAHVVSWVPAGGEEALYLSERSAFEAGRAIRGGIPVIFPQFADRGPLPQHGFARTQAWSFAGVTQVKDGARAIFTLEPSAQSMAMWPHDFRLELLATIGGARLEVEMRVLNPGQDPFAFTAALHTYLRVSDAATVRLHGLQGTRFVERGSNAIELESREVITASEPIDRIYFATPAESRLEDGNRTLHIAQRRFTDTVVWNPGRERSATMTDMPPEGFRNMLCVEAAAIKPLVALAPGETWSAAQTITVST